MLRIKGRFCMVLIFILVFALFGETGFAATSKRAAEIKEFSGSVSIKRAGGEKRYKPFAGMALVEGDAIVTGVNGKISLSVSDELEFIVAENTEILISKLIKSETGASITRIDLKTGGVWSKIKKKLSSDSKYEIKTPTVVLGARGTEFYTRSFLSEVQSNLFKGSIYAAYFEVNTVDGKRIEKLMLEVILQAGQTVKISGTPKELKDFFITTLKLEDLDKFSLEMLKELIKEYPELKEIWKESEIDFYIEIKNQEAAEKSKAYQALLEKIQKELDLIEPFFPVVSEPEPTHGEEYYDPSYPDYPQQP